MIWNSVLLAQSVNCYCMQMIVQFCTQTRILGLYLINLAYDDKQADVIDAFNTTSRYLGDILNINNVYF